MKIRALFSFDFPSRVSTFRVLLPSGLKSNELIYNLNIFIKRKFLIFYVNEMKIKIGRHID